MPHIIVKLWPGRSEREKRDLTDRIVDAVTGALGYGDDSVSVALEEISPALWRERVYKPDILDRPELLTKKPGYRM